MLTNCAEFKGLSNTVKLKKRNEIHNWCVEAVKLKISSSNSIWWMSLCRGFSINSNGSELSRNISTYHSKIKAHIKIFVLLFLRCYMWHALCILFDVLITTRFIQVLKCHFSLFSDWLTISISGKHSGKQILQRWTVGPAALLWHHKVIQVLRADFRAQFLCVHSSVIWCFDTFTVLI